MSHQINNSQIGARAHGHQRQVIAHLGDPDIEPFWPRELRQPGAMGNTGNQILPRPADARRPVARSPSSAGGRAWKRTPPAGP